jgi:excisionase family DNA binding protein
VAPELSLVVCRYHGYGCCRDADDRKGCVRPAPLLTRKEAAARLHVSASTMIRLGRSGAVTEIRIARSVRIDPASVEAFIRSRRSRGGAGGSARSEWQAA